MNLKTVLEELEAKKAIIIDIREKEEWDTGHLKFARLFPTSRLLKGEVPENLPTDIPIYIHCARGGRAEKAEIKLKKDYPNIVALKVDFSEFKKAGFLLE